jgi:hypothetical protein
MVRCPRTLADPRNGIDVVNASEFGDGGFERLHLLVPVGNIYSLDPCDLALLVELVCKGLGALGVPVSYEDLRAERVSVWPGGGEGASRPSPNEHRCYRAANAAGATYNVSFSFSNTTWNS